MVVRLGLEKTLKRLAKVALFVGGIAAVAYATPYLFPSYPICKSGYAPIVVAAVGGAGAGYVATKAG